VTQDTHPLFRTETDMVILDKLSISNMPKESYDKPNYVLSHWVKYQHGYWNDELTKLKKDNDSKLNGLRNNYNKIKQDYVNKLNTIKNAVNNMKNSQNMEQYKKN